MAENKAQSYKYCVVPMCSNTTVTTSNKLFFSVPRHEGIRRKWCKLMRRDQFKSSQSRLHCCEDHFNLEEDMANFLECKMMKANPRLKVDVVPHKFECQKPEPALKLKMSQEIVKLEVNNAISLENSIYVKEEFQDEYDPKDKVWISKTTIIAAINTSSSELNRYIKNDETRKYEMLSVAHITTDLPSTEVEDRVSNNVKIEDGFHPVDIKLELCSGLLFCKNCHEAYEDYCTNCRVLVHILNKSPCDNRCNRTKELPKCMLETRESFGRWGIFSLKVIPKDVRFGPFTGHNSTGVSMKIKGGRFVVSNDKSEYLNWMQYINSARNIYEQNLFPFQYQSKLYYRSTRRIEEGEELLVYFGEEYEDKPLKDVEMDFVPITEEDVENAFACTFCCLGFSSKDYLAEHKAVTHSKTNEMLSVEELVQCSFCKIYLEAKEYFEQHMDYCRETNDSTQTPQEIGDIIESHNEQNTSNQRHAVLIRVDNKAAQKLKDKHKKYRDKHREEINKRKRESRLNKKISQSILKDATTKERSRTYRERHREEINRRRRESRQHQRNVQPIPTASNVHNINT